MKLIKVVLTVAAMLVTNIVTAVTLDTPINAELNAEGVRAYLVRDFNGGGLNDLLVTDTSGTAHIYLSEDEIFNDNREIPQTSGLTNNLQVSSLATADFNNDGTLDLALGPYFCDNSEIHFAVMLNDGKARFTPAPCIGPDSVRFTYLETGVTSMDAGDLNGDGNPDLVISTSGYLKAIYAYFGNGDGTFGARVTIYQPKTTGFLPRKVVIIDANEDGMLDIMFHSGFYSTSEIIPYLFTGNGAGDFMQVETEQLIPSEVSNYPQVQAEADTWSTEDPVETHIVNDFNGDGLGDIITLYSDFGENTRANVYLQTNDTTATTAPEPTPAPTGTAEVFGDDEAPEVEILDPEEAISGTYTFVTESSDNVAVLYIEFYIDSVLVLNSTIDTTQYANGEHDVQAIVYDEAGNVAEHGIVVTINN